MDLQQYLAMGEAEPLGRTALPRPLRPRFLSNRPSAVLAPSPQRAPLCRKDGTGSWAGGSRMPDYYFPLVSKQTAEKKRDRRSERGKTGQETWSTLINIPTADWKTRWGTSTRLEAGDSKQILGYLLLEKYQLQKQKQSRCIEYKNMNQSRPSKFYCPDILPSLRLDSIFKHLAVPGDKSNHFGNNYPLRIIRLDHTPFPRLRYPLPLRYSCLLLSFQVDVL